MKAGHRLVWLLAGALLLAGCQYDGVVTELLEESRGGDTLAISFGNGVIDAPVRTKAGQLSLLSEHTSSMGVWGWQTTKDELVVCLFLNQEVTYNPELDQWTYSPAKYWETGSSYKFYAYAPHGKSVTDATVTINDETGHINIQGITLNGDNTMSTTAQPQPLGTFKSVHDTDWMIDRTGQFIPKERIHTRVTFNMQHILAKFNVMVKASTAITESGNQVVLDSLAIGDFLSKADFSQKLNRTPVSTDTLQEWVIDSLHQHYTLYGTKDATVPSSGCCVIESLLLPQNVTASQQVYISYSIHSEGGRVEHFTYLFDLDDAFTKFESANNYTLHITIGPEIITFDAGSTLWDNEPARHSWIN
ncbi:MAG: fimbrillin family protein [Bacteroidaceae bacterium]|nr:fimbrillin family protein [Bacteroidaceae bacterium]